MVTEIHEESWTHVTRRFHSGETRYTPGILARWIHSKERTERSISEFPGDFLLIFCTLFPRWGEMKRRPQIRCSGALADAIASLALTATEPFNSVEP
jgi:hypothetical protein